MHTAWQSYYLKNDDEMREHRAIEKSIIEKLLVNAGVAEEQVCRCLVTTSRWLSLIHI